MTITRRTVFCRFLTQETAQIRTWAVISVHGDIFYSIHKSQCTARSAWRFRWQVFYWEDSALFKLILDFVVVTLLFRTIIFRSQFFQSKGFWGSFCVQITHTKVFFKSLEYLVFPQLKWDHLLHLIHCTPPVLLVILFKQIPHCSGSIINIATEYTKFKLQKCQ